VWPIYRRHIQHDFLDQLGADTERVRTALEAVAEKRKAVHEQSFADRAEALGSAPPSE
jgi:hypothetical protein